MGAPPFSQAKFAIYARRGKKPLQDAHMARYFLCLGTLGQKLDITVALFLLMFVCFFNRYGVHFLLLRRMKISLRSILRNRCSAHENVKLAQKYAS